MNDDSFFSIDRLVEFGMGMSIAQQMVNTMNNAISNMQVPGSTLTMHPHLQFYYVVIENKQSGPFTEQELTRLIIEKKITKETFIWKPGMSNWELAENVPEILKLVALAPPPII
jgi:hypothetical protein